MIKGKIHSRLGLSSWISYLGIKPQVSDLPMKRQDYELRENNENKNRQQMICFLVNTNCQLSIISDKRIIALSYIQLGERKIRGKHLVSCNFQKNIVSNPILISFWVMILMILFF